MKQSLSDLTQLNHSEKLIAIASTLYNHLTDNGSKNIIKYDYKFKEELSKALGFDVYIENHGNVICFNEHEIYYLCLETDITIIQLVLLKKLEKVYQEQSVQYFNNFLIKYYVKKDIDMTKELEEYIYTEGVILLKNHLFQLLNNLGIKYSIPYYLGIKNQFLSKSMTQERKDSINTIFSKFESNPEIKNRITEYTQNILEANQKEQKKKEVKDNITAIKKTVILLTLIFLCFYYLIK